MSKEKQHSLYRVFGTCVLILLQIAWILVFVFELASYSIYTTAFFTVFSLLMALHIINKDDNPAYKIAWLIPILAAPLVGGLMYFLYGDKKPAKFMRKKLDAEYEITKPFKAQDPEAYAHLKEVSERFCGTSRYVCACGYPIFENTEVTYYSVGEDMFQAMMAEMEKAEHYIFLEYFIIEEGVMWDQMLDLMTKKAANGVDVRLIYDDMGSAAKLPGKYDRQMEEKGIKCMRFNPFLPVFDLVMNNRDHRKILVIDGHTAFNGGINLSDEYINEVVKFGHWKDTGVCLKGEGVWNFTLMFLEMWNAYRKEDVDLNVFRPKVYHPEPFKGDGFVQPYSDTPLDEENLGENVYMEILAQAKRYVYIMTPYLIVDHEMKTALCQAAKRGVDVRIITPGIPDKPMVFRLTRSNYKPLLEAGVRIYEYTPGFIHAKSFVSDDKLGVVGTINLDYRSLYLHFECATMMYRCPALMDLKKDSLETMEKSKEIQPGEFHSTWLYRLLDAILRVCAPLF